MARTKRWVWQSPANGYGEVRLTSWKYFHDFIYHEMQSYDSYIWRGHRCEDWTLESTFDRMVRLAKVAKTKRRSFRDAHLEAFKLASRGRRGNNPPVLEAENDWWALGQHHGLATPLLDWTLSPFVAAYFAFINEGKNQTRNRAVFALHRPSVETTVQAVMTAETAEKEKRKAELTSTKALGGLLALGLDTPAKPQVEFIRPFSDENQRLVNQGGLFTRSPLGVSLEDWVQKNQALDDRYTLIKIIIPDKDRDNCLRSLNRMNINHLSLFPDLYGASKFCNLFSEIDQY